MAVDDSSVVVDASVVAKWYVPEREADVARALRDEFVNGAVSLSAPALMPFEVTNALRYSDLLDSSALEQAVESLSKYGVDLVPFVEIDGIVTAALTVDIPVYDASYLALAHATDSQVYTADTRLVDAAAETEYEAHVSRIEDFGV